MRLVDLFWLIAPETHHDGLVVSWMDLVIPARRVRTLGRRLLGSSGSVRCCRSTIQVRGILGPVSRTARTRHGALSHGAYALSDREHRHATSSVEADTSIVRGVFGFGIGLAVVTVVVHLAMF